MSQEQEYEVVRLVGNERRVGHNLSSVSRTWQGKDEKFVFVSPHDDDAVIGGGLVMQLALKENVPVYILIVTDGSMGYCSEEERETISEIRKRETYECYQSLGIEKDHIIWLGFPDCRLNFYRGRRPVEDGQKEYGVFEGHTGLQNAFTYYLRQIRPSQCFVPTSSDLHPDHKFVHEELLISLFHAAGDIWPELGEPLEKVPHVIELGVYCDFPEPPNVRLKAPESALEKKLAGISAFRSQKQIGSLVDIIRKTGPQEYLRGLQFQLYQPTKYYDRFEEQKSIPFVRR